MASSVLCGQTALLGLASVHKKEHEKTTTLIDVALPKHLKVDRKRLKGAQTAGMEVFKLSKVRL